MDNPCTSWLADSSWDNITELDKLPNFHGIMTSFEQYPRDWNLWFTSPEPESATLPGLYMLIEIVLFLLCCVTKKFFPIGTMKLKCTILTGWVYWCVIKAACSCCCALAYLLLLYLNNRVHYEYDKKILPQTLLRAAEPPHYILCSLPFSLSFTQLS